MEIYHSTRLYKNESPQPTEGFVQEYRLPNEESFVAYSAAEGDRFVPTDLDYKEFGYRWCMGFCPRKSIQARTFVAPHDGLISIDFLNGIRYWLCDKEALAVQLWHNQTLLFPELGKYADDLYPINDREIFNPEKLYRIVEAGDKIRFIVRSLKEDNNDDLVCEQEIAYLFGGAIEHKIHVAPGKTALIPTYTTKGAVRFISRDPQTVAVGTDGTLLGLTEGCGLVQLVFADGSEDYVEVLVSSNPETACNPLAVKIEQASPDRNPGGGLGISEEDTLQLCARLGQAVITHGDRVASATREDRYGEAVKLLENDVLYDTVDATFLDTYRGGRTLKEMTFCMRSYQDANYKVRFFYSTTKAPQQFIYLTTVKNPLPISMNRFPTIRLTPTTPIEDVHTLRAQLLRTDGKGIELCEWDAWLEEESNEVQALRCEQRQSFWLPGYFADNMVFQREKPIHVWGYSKAEGATLTLGLTDAEGKTHAATATVENGKFEGDLPAQEATTKGLTLTVSGLGQSVAYHNIWIGDVWLVAGQSNMGITANWIGQQGYTEEFEAMKERVDEAQPIRMFQQMHQAGDRPCRDCTGGVWKENNWDNASQFSAIGYYAARLMQKEIGVPFALIDVSIAGTWLQSWVPETFFDGSEASDKFYLDWFHREQLFREAWCRPCGPYNGMIAPLVGFTAAGVFWYQGSNNLGQTKKFYNYGRQLKKFIRHWRTLFNNENMPFVVVQMLSNLCYTVPNMPKLTGGIDNPSGVNDLAMLFMEAMPKEPTENMYGYVSGREQQRWVETELDNVLTVVATDMSNKTHDVHPPNKLPLAERMGEQALGAFYGFEGLRHSPTFKEVKKTDGGLLVTFDHAEGGLKLSNDLPVQHFEVSEDGYNFTDAEAVLTEDGILVKTETATYVRHAFESCPEVNVYNQAGYPLEGFRAGVAEGRIWDGPFTVKISK